jgi:hypothetical protein
MKFKDVRTIESILTEYGMKPGASTPTSQQSTGANAKANATSPTLDKKPEPKKDLGSPTTTPGLDVKDPEQEPKFTPIKAKDIEVDAEYHDDKGNVLGKVVSKVGDKPNPDKVVVQDPKGEYQLVEPDEEVQMLNASKLSKLSKSTASSFNLKKQAKNKKNKLKKIRKKMKKLVRKFKLREQGEEQLFEINFNQKSIAQSALKMPIKCGFEAETSWDDVYGGDDDDDWLYEYNWYDIEDMLRDQEGPVAVNDIDESYNEWIQEKAFDYEGEEVADIVAEREEDEYYLNQFIEDVVGEDDIEEYKERILDDLPEEDHDEYEDWDFMNWGRQYVEEELLDDYKEWLEENVRDEGEAMDRAFDRARDEYDIDTWANDEYGSWSSCLHEFGYYLSNPDGGGGGQEEVAGYLRDWAEDNSITDEVQAGDYHAGYGDTKQSYWRVEGDPSISTSGTGSEIISPVYKTPQAMLTEMKSLFTWMDKFDVETNSSTGLHVTMSWNGEKANDELNKVKMAVLLGDKYLLSTFGREGNTYAKSQYDNLKRMGQELKSDPDNLKTVKQIEKILAKGISGDKYSSINFKGDTDRDSGNHLIEFRIGGGRDYHQDFDNCAKAVIRYATIMSAGHQDGQFQSEYVKALFKFINKLDKIDDSDVERAKGDIEHPAIDILKDFFGKDNYVSGVQNLNHAFYNLDLYKKFTDPEADAKWKRDIENYEKGTGEKVDIEEVEQAEPINAYIRPESSPPSKRAKTYLEKAQKYFMVGLLQAGYDLNQNLNRKPVSAKGIGVLRKTIKEFELDYNELDKRIPAIEKSIEFGGRNYPNAKTRMQRLKNGVDRLFKKTVVSMPEFLTHQQVEKITNGLWSAFASGELQDGNKSKDFFNAYAEAKGVEPEQIAQEWDELVRSRDVGEYKDFHGKLTRGHRDYLNFEAGEPINAKGLDKLLAHLKTYPKWNHPVAKGHNPAITGGDSYENNALSKMMMKMRTRFDAIEELKEEEPAKYYDTIKKLGNIGADLIADVAVHNEDDSMGEIYPELRDTEYDRHFDGERYIGMRSRTQEKWGEMLDDMARGNPSSPFGESVVMLFKDRTQNFLRSVLDNYYDTKNENPDFYKNSKVSEIVSGRFAAVKEFLTKIDDIAQDIGFDSEADAIAKKKELGNKAKAYDKEHGPKALYTIKGFSFGGDIYISKEAARDILNLGDDLKDRSLYDKIVFARDDSPHSSQYHTLKAVPHSDYFLALEADEILENPRLKDNWRIDVAKQVTKEWYGRYKMSFDSFRDDYSTLNNNPEILKLFKDRKVVIDDSLGDGRVGMKGFGHEPLGFKPAELEGPHGEPFSLSAAGAWKVNNPELAKKVKADELKRRNSIDVQIPVHAGVTDKEGMSSSSIADATNWVSLSKYLKIETGVNEQGANLLKKVYNQYDNDHNWRPDSDPDACCMPRYVSAVKAAKEYIEKNYIVSGGNYFRKNPDGSAGDNVSAVHGSSNDPSLGEIDSVELTDTSYAEAKGNYEKFDGMMQNGIGNYILSADADRLVKFLVGAFSEKYKSAVLHSMIVNKSNGGEPVDIQQALALGKRILRLNPQYQESVFAKFDNLSLQEQIDLIAKVDKKKIDEAWSKKYKDSINCSNPKGFSQKAHCDGKKKKMSERPLTKDEKSDKEKYVKGMKKNKGDFEKRYGKDAKAVMYATATKMAKESVNDFNRIKIINNLLADHFPVSDLKKQMQAYQAIPMPQMLDAFRDLRAEAGDDACARSIVRFFVNNLPDEMKMKINLNEWSKQHVKKLLEAKGIMGRVVGDRFQRGDDTLEFSGVVTYPQDRETFDDSAERDSFVADIEQQLNAQIEWTNAPNSGSLAFAIAELTDPALNDKPTFWGRYFRKAGADMMGKWGNSQVPAGWKLQKAGALKLDIGIDPQHLIKNENLYNGIDEVISTVAKNSQGHEIQQELLNGLTSIKNREHPVFEGQIKNLPALRDYFGEIMGPVALMAGMVGGQAEDARQELMNGAEWSSYGVKWPQEMNFALVDSIFVGPDGTEVGISSKGGSGARASAKNIADAIAKASNELKQAHAFTVQVLNIIQENSAAQGPFRLAEFLGVLPTGLEKEILTYAKEGKTDYEGLSSAAQELFTYGTPRQDVPGFNTGYALVALLAKKVAKLINENPGFGPGCLAFLNQSSIVQLYCKMGKQGENARVTGWDAVYPPNFQGTVVLDGSKNYYSSRIGGKFAFGFV